MPTRNRPNILIFFVDQMQQQVIQPDHPCQMPRVQQLAEEGVMFTNNYTPSPHCCPSRATLMSGCYPSRHGIWNNVNTNTAFNYSLKPGIRLFSEFLCDAGYRLGHAGKWHVSYDETPADRGWKEYSRYEPNKLSRSNADWVEMAKKQGAPGEREEGLIPRPGWPERRLWGKAFEGPDAYEKMRWYDNGIVPGLAGLKELTSQDDPWCLCISTDTDHTGAVPAELEALYNLDDVDLPPSVDDPMLDKPNIYRRIRQANYGGITEAEKRKIRLHYWALSTLQDQYFGMILDALEASGQADNTLVIFVSDHADYNMAHGLINMGIPCFREAYHVPLVMRWPDGIRNPGREVDDFTTLADIAPTLLSLAGVDTDFAFTGKSLDAFLGDQAPSDWPDAFFTQCNGNESFFMQRSVMTRTHKFVCNWFDFDELYDLQADPHELTNLAWPDREEAKSPDATGPWPHLPQALDRVRQDLIGRMWRFACEQDDLVFNSYPTAAIPPYGPLMALSEME